MEPRSVLPPLPYSPLLAAEALGASLGVATLFLKLDGVLPTGTHKARAAWRIAAEAGRRGETVLTAGSCGNYGLALAAVAEAAGLQCVIFVPAAYRSEAAAEIPRYGATVVPVEGTYEAAVEASRRHARRAGALDANPGGEYDDLLIASFGEIALEIRSQLAVPVTDFWIPVGNGTTATGVFRACRHLEHPPRVHIVGSLGNTAAVCSVDAGRVVRLDPAGIKPDAVNEALVNWESLHAAGVLEAVEVSGGSATAATNDQLRWAAERIHAHCGLAVTPAGAAGLVGLSLNAPCNGSGCHVVLVTASRRVTWERSD